MSASAGGWRTLLGPAFYVFVVALLPLLVLCGAGLFWLWDTRWLLPALGVWLLLVALMLGVLALLRWLRPAQTVGDLPATLPPREGWTDQEQALWEALQADIGRAVSSGVTWSALQDEALLRVGKVAAHYHPGDQSTNWHFTLPDGLLIIEETARRYRALVDDHVPYADRLTIEAVFNLYQRREQLQTGARWLNRLRRVARLGNPAAAVLGELRELLTGHLFDRYNADAQAALKKLLLEEVTQVAIDLYSGHLRAASTRGAAPASPVRVLLLGQPGAGKGALISALRASLETPVEELPAEWASTYRLRLHDVDLEIIDSPGLTDGADLGAHRRAAATADLIVWVASAVQPARAPLAACARDLGETTHPSPHQLLVLTHADRLTPGDWSPPYNLNSAQPAAVAMYRAGRSVAGALSAKQDLAIVPVCLQNPPGYYNVDAVAAHLRSLLARAGEQRDRRDRQARHAAAQSHRAQWQKLLNLGRVVGRAARE